MSYLTLSGSPAPDSANSRLLAALAGLTSQLIIAAPNIAALPVFQPALDRSPWPPEVLAFRAALSESRAVIFSTPSYLHNLPGVLKNALDWLASSGELDGKPVLAFSLTPGAPRGERARQSLLWSLDALNARVVAEAALYQADLAYAADGTLLPGPTTELLLEALQLLP